MDIAYCLNKKPEEKALMFQKSEVNSVTMPPFAYYLKGKIESVFVVSSKLPG